MKTAQIAPPPVSLEDAFSLGEASMNLEGFHPEQDAMYLALKERIRAGEITFREAIAEVVASASNSSQRNAA